MQAKTERRMIMIIQQIRNAAVKVKYSGIVFLTDPWLQRKSTGPSLETCRPDIEKVCKEAPEAVLAQVLVPANGEKITV